LDARQLATRYPTRESAEAAARVAPSTRGCYVVRLRPKGYRRAVQAVVAAARGITRDATPTHYVVSERAVQYLGLAIAALDKLERGQR
jgi:hypothetical protein